MEETLERIPGDVTWELLPETYDIDVPADLERFRQLGKRIPMASAPESPAPWSSLGNIL